MITKPIYNCDGSVLTNVNVKEVEDVVQEAFDRPPTKAETRWTFANAVECLMWGLAVVTGMGFIISLLDVMLGASSSQTVTQFVCFLICTILQVIIALICKWAKSTKMWFGTERGGLWWAPVLLLVMVLCFVYANLTSAGTQATLELLQKISA